MKSREGLKATVQFTFHLRNLQIPTLKDVETLECQTRDSAVNAVRAHMEASFQNGLFTS